jgi:hypothetical protein
VGAQHRTHDEHVARYCVDGAAVARANHVRWERIVECWWDEQANRQRHWNCEYEYETNTVSLFLLLFCFSLLLL